MFDWWRTPEQQLERARELWPSAVLPEAPKEFVPRTQSEVLLLHVPDSFNSLWDKIVAPKDYTTLRTDHFDPGELWFTPSRRDYTEPIWLAFDSECGWGQRPDSLWDRSDLAASEILSALIQFTDWSLSWLDGAPEPNFGGYKLKYELGPFRFFVPTLSMWQGPHQLRLSAIWAGHSSRLSSSPSVREC